jgi:CRISPR/Cas system-associated protein endoribonuclease Cas2
MFKSQTSPIIGYKIAIVNGADLNNEFKLLVPEEKDEEGNVTKAEVKERQFVRASKRQMRAVRKARTMIGSYKNVMLFGERKDGTHFPVTLRPRTMK